MAWRDTASNFEQNEWQEMSLLKGELPAYLDFHEQHLGHLPQNFVETSGAALKEDDPRYEAIDRIGFFSYAVCVNLILLERVVRELPKEFRSALEVYDHAGRFFLRAGAATDIAVRLAKEVEQDFDHKTGMFCPHPLGDKGTSLGEELEKSLGAANAYNNGIKHNGLPAIQLETQDGGTELRVLIPRKFTGRQHGWLTQKPQAEMVDVFRFYRPKVFGEFNAFYGKLTADVSRRLGDWGICAAGTVHGILDLKTTGSGSFAVSDGYVPAWPRP